MKMTVHEAHERILELDDMIFKVDTGQVRVTWEQRNCLKIEVQALMDALAKSIAAVAVFTNTAVPGFRSGLDGASGVECRSSRGLEIASAESARQCKHSGRACQRALNFLMVQDFTLVDVDTHCRSVQTRKRLGLRHRLPNRQEQRLSRHV